MIDAPVSGGVAAAETGTLSIMVGGTEAGYRAAEALLLRLGSTVTHVGGNGQGLLLDLAINVSLAAQKLAFNEGVLLAERGGIDPLLAARAIGSPLPGDGAPILLDLPGQARLSGAGVVWRGAPAQGHPPRACGGPRVRRCAPGGGGRRQHAQPGRARGLRWCRANPALQPAGDRMTQVITTHRGRPRSETAHKAVLAAAAELLLDHGLHAVSMDAVAERAGVSKATIYRWWPKKEILALDMLFTEWVAVTPARYESGVLRSDLTELLRAWAQLASGRPYGRVVAALLAEARTDPAFSAEYQRRMLEPRRDQARMIFASAVARGEISGGTKIEVAIDLLYGPLYHRLLHGHAPLDDQFVDDIVDMALRGIHARA